MRPELERRLAVLVEPLERAVLDGVREFEGELDRARIDLGVVPVFVDERPLIGLAGLLDWRSSGRLSAIVRSGFFTGAWAERLLTPGERRWPTDRLVLIGLGARAEFDDARARALASRCMEIATGLEAETVLIALPAGSIERRLIEVAFASLLDTIQQAPLAPKPDAIDDRAESHAVESAAARGGEELAGARGEEEGEAPSRELAVAPGEEEGEAPSRELAVARGGEEEGEAPSREEEGEAPSREEEGEAPSRELAVAPGEQEGEAPSGESADDEPRDPVAPGSQPASQPTSPVARRWWVVADPAVVARLRRVRSGPPRAADAGSSLYT